MSNSNSTISNSKIKTNKPTATKMTLGLSAIAAAMFATSAFAEPPIQPGDTLESLSKATVQTTINGQPGSLEQMGIPKQVIAQAIAQNAVIDVQARTLRPMNALVSSSTQASSQSPQATIHSMQSEQSAPVESEANISTTNVETPVNVETDAEVTAHSALVVDDASVQQAQQVAQNVESMDANVESELSAQAGEISETEQSTMTEAQNQLAQAQSTTEQASMQTAELNAAVDTAITEADQTVASAQADVQNGMDQNAAALMPEADQDAIDPNAQAVPAEDMHQTEDATQLAEPEMDATTPLQ